MKRLNDLYEKTYEIDNVIKMINRVCARVQNKEKVNKFELYKAEHITNIINRLKSDNLNLGKYNIFMITDPKCRIIMSQNLEDKIINHLIAEHILVKTFEPKFIDSMIATRVNKGTHYGIKLMKKYLNEVKSKHDNFYFLKIDISKYFYSIDHSILKSILKKHIKDKKGLDVLFSIIDSTNYEYINKEIIFLKGKRIDYLNSNNVSNKNKLIEEVLNIPTHKFGKGVPIGDQTSQIFGLIYLLDINHFIKEKLHIKYVINYMDDFIIIHEDKNYLKHCLKEIIKMLDKYKLKINTKKTRVDNIKVGIDFLGYIFYVNNNKIVMKLRKHTKYKFKKKVINLQLLLENDCITTHEFDLLISSYKGLLKWGNCKNLYYKVMEGDRNVREVL